MQQATISAAKNIVKKCINFNLEKLKANQEVDHAPVYLHSSPGIGKSSIVLQTAKELGIGFIDVRLAQMEQSDVAGIPFVATSAEVMKISVPEWFPSKEKIEKGEKPQYGILFFDELSNAPLGVQHAAYGIILDRMVHGVELGDGWQIVAAGNLKTDKTGAKGVAPALANRFGTHLEIKATLEDFSNYAVSKGFNHQIIGYLNFQPANLYSFDPAKTGSDVAFATPRSWEMVSRHLERGYTQDEIVPILVGCVGERVSTDFMAFQKYYMKLPNFVDIMDGKEEYKVPQNDMGLMFAVSSSLIACLMTNADNKKRVENLKKVMVQMPDDFLVLIYKSMKPNESVSAKIFVQTMDIFKKIVKYIQKEA